MSGAVRVRPMTVEDVDAVMSIAEGLETAPHWTRAAYEAALDPSAPGRLGLVAVLDGEVIGFAIASFIAPEAELETIAVSPAQQRRKAGSELLTALRRELEALEITEMVLEVRASNLAAQAFYRAHSFASIGERPGYFRDTGESAVLMRARIAKSEK